MEQLVKEVGDRLVLIVQKEKEFFGFELRSFQEFFAAVYLVQTAADTRQRFDRLKAIARYEHWRNVALFVAGRIARTFPGGEVLQLGQAWRAVDRDGVSRYLKPGAWFALQIAADGALSDETDLQYSAIEDGLKVLETGLTREQQNQLKFLAKRLPQKEQGAILRPILEDKLRSLPESCLATALDLYSQCFGATPFFQEKIDVLLQSQRENVVVSALKLALEHKTDPTWMVERLRNHLSYSKQQLPMLWFRSQEYVEQLLSAWSLSNAEITELAEATLSMWRYGTVHTDKEPLWALSEPNSLLDQLIMMLRCGGLSAYCLINCHSTEQVDLGERGETWLYRTSKLNPLISAPDGRVEALDNLLKRSDLMPALRVHLWRLFWFINKPNRDNVSAFLEDIEAMQHTQALPNSFSQYPLLNRTWPLLALAVERQTNERADVVKCLLPFLDANSQLSVAEQVAGAIRDYVEQAGDKQKKQLFNALQTSIGLEELLPELVPLATKLSLTLEDLVDVYVMGYSYGSSSYAEYTTAQLKKLLTTAEEAINDREQLARLLDSLNRESWSYTPEILKQAKQLLAQILKHWSYLSDLPLAASTATFFLRLLTYDTQVKQIAPHLFTTLFQTELVEPRPWRLSNILGELSSECVFILKSFLTHNDKNVRVGSALILKALIEVSGHYISMEDKEVLREIRNIRFDPDLGRSFVEHEDSKRRLVGIGLLTWSDYPVENVKYRNQLLVALQHARKAEEEEAWAQLLHNIPISEEKQSKWSSVFEEILAEPRIYGNLVLSTAMERYQRLNSAANVTISEEQEKELGLP